MAAPYFLATLLLLTGLVASTPSPRQIRRQDASATTSAENTICGDIINDVNDGEEHRSSTLHSGAKLTEPGYFYFYASDAFACLSSVPFNDAVALRFIDYYNTTLQFQSTLSYLKTPPTGYQQPAVDLVAGLQGIKNNVTAGVYKNQ